MCLTFKVTRTTSLSAIFSSRHHFETLIFSQRTRETTRLKDYTA